MVTRVVITVDTEPSIAGHYDAPDRFRPLIHEPIFGPVNGKSESLVFLIRTLEKNQLAATFFVETLHEHYFQDSEMQTCVAQLVAAGQDVQLHLHPTWLNLRHGAKDGTNRISDHCYDLGAEALDQAITRGCDLLESWAGRRPTSMRTGNFSTDRSVFKAAARCGLKTASNLNISSHKPSEKSLQISGGVAKIEGIWEYPVTNFSDIGLVGRGRPRPMQVTSLSFAEMTRILNQTHAKGGSIAVIITHPFEFTKKKNAQFEGLTANRLVQRRFERLCRYLNRNRDRFDVVPIGVLGGGNEREEPAQDLQGNGMMAFGRAASNFLNDLI